MFFRKDFTLYIIIMVLIGISGCGVIINSPENGDHFTTCDVVRLSASRRAFTSGEVEWGSSIDGDLGEGSGLKNPDPTAMPARDPLSVGEHKISVTVQSTCFMPSSWSDSVNITVTNASCP